MVNLTVLKLRRDIAFREMKAAEEIALQKRRIFEQESMQFLDTAEACGLCRFCLKPKNQGIHEGRDHVALATDECSEDRTVKGF